MRFADLVATSTAVARASSRLEKLQHLAVWLQRVAREAPADIEIAVALLAGTPRQGRVGVGFAAIDRASGTPAAAESTLELVDVDRTLTSVADATGAGSTTERLDRLRTLLARATAAEQDFLRRLLFGELRQGALEGVLLEAVARAARVAPARLRRAAMVSGSLTVAAEAALTGGESALAAITLRVLQPVQPMLAQPADSVAEALGQLGEAALEDKIDGARIQVHKAGDDVRVFSRTLNDVTASVPEIVTRVRAFPARSAILDGEVVALTRDGRPHPFQTTMRRFGRTRGVEALQRELPLTPFFFDCLQVDDRPLIDDPYERRIEALAELARETAVRRLFRPTTADAEAFVREALGRGFEGVMAKDLASPYAAGRRGAAWLKVKPVQTLDLVVLAAEWGSGRRKGWLSNLHLGARDASTNDFVMLGKTFKGLTDEMLAWQTAHLLSIETGRDRHIVFVRPSLVVEIAFNDLQISPVYPGGLALRFARVKRYRLDKGADQADTIDAVRAIREADRRGEARAGPGA
jgi:DNA ligase-1